MSSVFSMPTDMRTKPSVIPNRSRTSRATDAWVIAAGRQIKLSTPPRLSADAVRVAVEKLGRRMHHDVHAKIQGPLQVGRHECVVADHADTRSVRDFRNSF